MKLKLSASGDSTYDEYLANFESEFDGQFDINSGTDNNLFEFVNDFPDVADTTLTIRTTPKDAPVFTSEFDFGTALLMNQTMRIKSMKQNAENTIFNSSERYFLS
ncbi:hypothetical protein MASR2M39_21320 [Ignavibacteriales bacterium]